MTDIEHQWAAFMDHIETGRLNDARAMMPRLVATYPTHDLSHCADGVFKMAIGDFVEAYESFESVTRANPRNLDAWIYTALASRETGTRGSLEKCRDILLRIIETFPEIVAGHRHTRFVLEAAAECCDEVGAHRESARLWKMLAEYSGDSAHIERSRQALANAAGSGGEQRRADAAVPRVVCFAPYVSWTLHGAREITLMHALRVRGYETNVVLCDGVFSDCDKYRGAGGRGKRPADACLRCQASSAARLLEWGTHYRWLGRWVNDDDMELVSRWTAALTPNTYERASYNGWPLGEWVKSSVHTHLRANELDMSDPAICETYASYLGSALLVALSLSRLYDSEKPTLQILFNGRMSIMRVALELAKQRGIRTICEERGYVLNRMMLYDNTDCLDARQFIALWRRWLHIPLNRQEIEELNTVMRQRREGASKELVISPPATSFEKLNEELDLDRKRPIWALFTSSLDECVAHSAFDSGFPSQAAWIEATIAYIARHPELQLVIRVHPNTAQTFQNHGNAQEIGYFSALAKRLPTNARLVEAASTISTYTLAEVAQVGLIWHSSVGMEMAVLGRKIIRAGTGWYDGESFTVVADNPLTYAALLDRVAANPFVTTDATVAAWRYAYLFFVRQAHPFPLVDVPDWVIGKMAYASFEDLEPGKHPSLDRICNALMYGTPLAPVPEDRSDNDAAAEYPAIRMHLPEIQGSRMMA